jgi:hypothetical protein
MVDCEVTNTCRAVMAALASVYITGTQARSKQCAWCSHKKIGVPPAHICIDAADCAVGLPVEDIAEHAADVDGCAILPAHKTRHSVLDILSMARTDGAGGLADVKALAFEREVDVLAGYHGREGHIYAALTLPRCRIEFNLLDVNPKGQCASRARSAQRAAKHFGDHILALIASWRRQGRPSGSNEIENIGNEWIEQIEPFLGGAQMNHLWVLEDFIRMVVAISSASLIAAVSDQNRRLIGLAM